VPALLGAILLIDETENKTANWKTRHCALFGAINKSADRFIITPLFCFIYKNRESSIILWHGIGKELQEGHFFVAIFSRFDNQF
jgi:hypothetical protein